MKRDTRAAQRGVPAAQGGRKSSDGAGAAVGGVALAAAQAIAAGKKVAPASAGAGAAIALPICSTQRSCLNSVTVQSELGPQTVRSFAPCPCSATLPWTLKGRVCVLMRT